MSEPFFSSYGDHAYGLQFHIEVTKETVPEWASIPAYAAALEGALGSGAAERLKEKVGRRSAATQSGRSYDLRQSQINVVLAPIFLLARCLFPCRCGAWGISSLQS